MTLLSLSHTSNQATTITRRNKASASRAGRKTQTGSVPYKPQSMPDEGPDRAEPSTPGSDANPDSSSGSGAAATAPVLTIVISKPEDEKGGAVAAGKTLVLPRCESDREQCRICQQQTEEPLMDLGCRCRGELAKAHRSCIDTWFRTRSSNKCEICQQIAANVPCPESQPSTNYWVWRVGSVYGRANVQQGERERGCFSPLMVAFSILVGGLLLDVLIAVSLGVSALPVNIIIGVLIVLGMGTAIRLAIECFYEWGSSSSSFQRTDTPINPMVMNPGYHP